jgi:hypothetical protein
VRPPALAIASGWCGATRLIDNELIDMFDTLGMTSA